MSSTTVSLRPMDVREPAAKGTSGSGGWLRRFASRVLAARQREADRRVADHLRGFDDETLRALQLDEAAIARLRKGLGHKA